MNNNKFIYTFDNIFDLEHNVPEDIYRIHDGFIFVLLEKDVHKRSNKIKEYKILQDFNYMEKLRQQLNTSNLPYTRAIFTILNIENGNTLYCICEFLKDIYFIHIFTFDFENMILKEKEIQDVHSKLMKFNYNEAHATLKRINKKAAENLYRVKALNYFE